MKKVTLLLAVIAIIVSACGGVKKDAKKAVELTCELEELAKDPEKNAEELEKIAKELEEMGEKYKEDEEKEKKFNEAFIAAAEDACDGAKAIAEFMKEDEGEEEGEE